MMSHGIHPRTDNNNLRNTPRYLQKDDDHLRASPPLSEFCELLVVLVPREERLAREAHSAYAAVQESPLPSTVE